MCDVGAIISAGVNLLLSDDDGGSQQYYDTSSAASQAAAEVARRQVELAERQYALEEPYRRKHVEAGIAALDRLSAITGRQLPLQLRALEEAERLGSQEEQEAAAARAAADARTAIEGAEQARLRRLSSLGLAKPGDPAFDAGARAAELQNAATLAQAATLAREAERARGLSARSQLAQSSFPHYNPNVPATNLSALGNAASTLQNIASSQATIGKQLYEQERQNLENIGKMLSTIGERVKTPPTIPTLPPEWGGVGAFPYQKGGLVVGPKHEGGGVPIEAEGGEFVIKAQSVRKYGPRLLKEVNDGTAIIIPTRPRLLKNL